MAGELIPKRKLKLKKMGLLKINNFWEAPPPQEVVIRTADLFGFHRKRQNGRRGGGGDSSAPTRVHWISQQAPPSPDGQGGAEPVGGGGAGHCNGSRSGRSHFDVLGLHHLSEGLLHPQDGEAGGGVESPTLGHQLQHGTETL